MHDHGLSFLETVAALLGGSMPMGWQPLVLPVAMFAAGLAGSLTHCAGMCGPFVVAQAQARLKGVAVGDYRGLIRLKGALALPYHLGRGITYTGLGALVGWVAGGIGALPFWPYLMAGLLGLAALLFFIQALGQAGYAGLPKFAARSSGLPSLIGALAKPVAGLLASPFGVKGIWLGVLLGFLPCGLLYGALSAAAGTGGALPGAIAMAAFVLGTMPGLMAISFGGSALLQQTPRAAPVIAAILYGFNALVLGFLAWQALSAV